MASYNKICKACKNEFIARRYDVETCSANCSVKWGYLKKKDEKLKALKIKECVWCGTQFLPKRIDSLFCSRKCASSYSYNHKKGLDHSIDFSETKVCALCNQEKELREFQKKGKKFLAACKECAEKWYKKRPIRQYKNVTYLQVEEFIHKIENKGYWADFSEIFELINLYDLVFPGPTMPNYSEPEYIFNVAFAKLYEWYRKEKKKLIKSG